MFALLIAVLVLVIYGSLFPWKFHPNPAVGNPFVVLLTAHSDDFNRRFLADIVINLLLYMPIGVTAYLAFHRFRSAAVRFALTMLLGIALSVSVEMLQLYLPSRRCSIIDVANNTVGTLLGIMVAMFLETVIRPRLGKAGYRRLDRAAIALLLGWVASMTFPLYPVMWLAAYRSRLGQLLHAPDFHGLVFVSSVASWYAVGMMLRTLAVPPRWLWIAVAVIPAQFFIMDRLPNFSEALGALAGIGIAVRLGRFRLAPWLFLGVLVLLGLAPFRIGAAHRFGFIPFQGFLDIDWQTGTRLLLEKSWHFGAAIWLLRSGPCSLKQATAVIAVTALIVEICQMYLPGRTPEITDAFLALLLGLAFRALRG